MTIITAVVVTINWSRSIAGVPETRTDKTVEKVEREEKGGERDGEEDNKPIEKLFREANQSCCSLGSWVD